MLLQTQENLCLDEPRRRFGSHRLFSSAERTQGLYRESAIASYRSRELSDQSDNVNKATISCRISEAYSQYVFLLCKKHTANMFSDYVKSWLSIKLFGYTIFISSQT